MARYFLVLCYNNIWVLCYQLEKILSYILLKDKTIEHYQMTPLYIFFSLSRLYRGASASKAKARPNCSFQVSVIFQIWLRKVCSRADFVPMCNSTGGGILHIQDNFQNFPPKIWNGFLRTSWRTLTTLECTLIFLISTAAAS